jgi:predicted ATP-grasp superfamily ATP-dependent carboligase
MTRHLVVVGASVRALACSATRAGWRVHAADLFGDADLRALACSVIRVAGRGRHGYPEGLAAVLATSPPGPWCYSGALENHPDLLDVMALRRPLAGNGGAAVRAVRDHAQLHAALAEAGLDAPATFSSPRGLPTDGSFLVKPRRSAGGRGIRPWHGGRTLAAHVWQERVAGRSLSLSFLCNAGGGRLWGASRQLVGRAWCHASPFAYCGSIAVDPGSLPAPMRSHVRRLGAVLGGGFGLVGLVGADVVLGASGRLHVIEINPRPTASMELTERMGAGSLAADHLAACGVASPQARVVARPAASDAAWAKAILFAPRALHVTPARAERLAALAAAWTARDGWPAVADIPDTDSQIPAGSPVITLFASAASETLARRRLRARTERLLAVLLACHAAGG